MTLQYNFGIISEPFQLYLIPHLYFSFVLAQQTKHLQSEPVIVGALDLHDLDLDIVRLSRVFDRNALQFLCLSQCYVLISRIILIDSDQFVHIRLVVAILDLKVGREYYICKSNDDEAADTFVLGLPLPAAESLLAVVRGVQG